MGITIDMVTGEVVENFSGIENVDSKPEVIESTPNFPQEMGVALELHTPEITTVEPVPPVSILPQDLDKFLNDMEG